MRGMPLHTRAEGRDFAQALIAGRARRVGVLAVELLDVAEIAPDRGVLREVAPVARHRLRVAGERLLLLAHLAGEPDHRTVGLELGERGLEDLARTTSTESVD